MTRYSLATSKAVGGRSPRAGRRNTTSPPRGRAHPLAGPAAGGASPSRPEPLLPRGQPRRAPPRPTPHSHSAHVRGPRRPPLSPAHQLGPARGVPAVGAGADLAGDPAD